ncbi:unnamed protein product [Cylicocyclus nassatus]|uniref:Uncharacterized protein n=1 Tax=Cylicocyclus nassatus TaxID=53992 RepID=A0AA36H420_CYLNA|nr:unnamed protein product [Cylicocyclus nassatus]
MCAAQATCSLLLAGGKLLLAKTESTCNDPRTKSKQFGSILLMKTDVNSPSFADETSRIAALLDPRFAFLERIAFADEWKTIVEKLIESKIGQPSSNQDSFDIPTSTARDKVSSFWDPIADCEHDSIAKRECKCWSAAEFRLYKRNADDSDDDDEGSSSVESPVEDTTAAFEDIEDLEDIEKTL